jgi:mannose-1-phosphate guanylyltransferase
LTDVDLRGLVAEHDRSGALVTMALIPNPRPDRYGGVLVDGGVVTGFTPRGAAKKSHHFIGVQVVEAAVFAPLPDNAPAETVGDLYPRLMREQPGSVRAFLSDASFEDIGTAADYFETSHAVAAREGWSAVPAGRRTSVANGARLTRSILWDDVVVDSGAELTECIVVDGVRVPAGAKLNRRIVLPSSVEFVGAGVERRDNLLIAEF